VRGEGGYCAQPIAVSPVLDHSTSFDARLAVALHAAARTSAPLARETSAVDAYIAEASNDDVNDDGPDACFSAKPRHVSSSQFTVSQLKALGNEGLLDGGLAALAACDDLVVDFNNGYNVRISHCAPAVSTSLSCQADALAALNRVRAHVFLASYHSRTDLNVSFVCTAGGVGFKTHSARRALRR